MSNDSEREDFLNNDVSFDVFEEWGHDHPFESHKLVNDLMERLTGDSWNCTPHRVTLGYDVVNSREIECGLTGVSFTVPQGKAAPHLNVEFTDSGGCRSVHRWWVHPDLVAQGPQAVWEAFAAALREEAENALFEVYDVVHALVAATRTERLKHEWPAHFHSYDGEPLGWDRADRGSVDNALEVLQDRYGPEGG